MNPRMIVAALAAAVLAGCASGVKLDDVPVEDRRGATIAPDAGTGTGSGQPGGQTQSRVAPVQADPLAGTAQGPQNVARIVLFDYDSYVIKPEYQNLIEAHARFLKSNNGRRVVVEGHTDERGGREYNLALGQRRAEAVRRSLGLLGVAEQQVEAVSFGKEKPANPASNEQAWAQNRRAEIAYRQ
ncbi:peptidoglycan-associated lipoprotein Pal [Ramlibacter sp.]|uniref:peptidoglycan-associated lipoprotein Pal n=1 Tax=Ramlibacter sp. TaxID=1917967 RepID=UPI003D09850B